MLLGGGPQSMPGLVNWILPPRWTYDLTTSFTSQLVQAIDRIFPTKVQEKIVERKKSFYKNKVQHLMNTDSRT